MKKSIKTIGLIIVIGVMAMGAYWLGGVRAEQTVDARAEEHPQQRVMTGNYYDYMVIETVDGNMWMLDDSEGSPYIEDGISMFEDGELVQVVFDTMGTDAVTDDVITSVRRIDRRR